MSTEIDHGSVHNYFRRAIIAFGAFFFELTVPNAILAEEKWYLT